MSQPPFVHRVEVHFYEVDQVGVVFNAWYLAWCDDARLAYCAARGYGIEEAKAADAMPLVRHADIEWLASLAAGDHAQIHVEHGELCFGRGDQHVAHQRHLEPTGDGKAVDRADDRPGARPERPRKIHVTSVRETAGAQHEAALARFFQVDAGREGPTRSGDDDRQVGRRAGPPGHQ